MVLPILGQSLLLLALLACVTGVVAGWLAGRRLLRSTPDATGLDDRLEVLAGRSMRVLLGATLGATFLLLLALAGSDFTLAYVQDRTSRDLSFMFRLTALWSGQEGSLLLWLTVLAGCGVGMVGSLRRAAVPAALRAFATSVLSAICAFFALLVAFVAQPFAVAEQLQRDGAGMSPALQNYWMALHPPTLYLGYVGVAVPFAIVMGALLARRSDDAWVATTRSWLVGSWIFLTLGLVLGARWAYEEIGWGGYWAWDPVENAALMPWLTATALLHSVMVQQRRGMMRFWNVVLAALTFGLSIFGTFLTRSGVLSSVHSFVSSPVGWWFIGALAVTIAGSMLLLYRSRGLLRARHDVDAVVSREGLLLFNNLLLVGLALVVLWGVCYPLLTAAFSESRISLEKPWYDFFAAAFGLPLVALLSLAPFIAWQGTPLRRVVQSMALPLAACLVLGVALVATGLGSSPSGIAAVCIGMLVVFGLTGDVARTLRARRAGRPDEPRGAAIVQVLLRHRRRWGAWLAHAGIALLVVAIAGSAWTTSISKELRVGEAAQLGPYELTYRDVSRERDGSRMRTRAVFDVERNGSRIGTMRAGRDFHPASGETSNEVAVRHDLLRMHDLFITVDRLTEDGVVRFQAFINPLMTLLWLAGVLTALGGVVVLVPERSRRAGHEADRNDDPRVESTSDAVHELRNGAAAPR